MRIAITGATGNLGTALLHRLSAGGHDLVGLARRTPQIGDPDLSEVHWVSADLTDDASRSALTGAFAGADAVVHLAWGFQPSHRLDLLEELGVGGTRRVAETAAEVGVPQLVHLSSLGAYAPKADDAPVDESYPTTGVPSSPYSRHKAAAERVLDDVEGANPDLTVTRMRPGIVGHAAAASALLRYAVPALVPTALLRAVPVLPLDRALRVPMVHADDVAEAIVRAIEQRAGGAFNVAADPPITVEHISRALGARHLQVPYPVVRTATAASWRLHLQQVDPGWVDLGYQLPLLDSSRARTELGWKPTHDAVAVLEETVEAMLQGRSAPTPVLRPRSVTDRVRTLVSQGPVALRRRS